jgi:hypothetical protein
MMCSTLEHLSPTASISVFNSKARLTIMGYFGEVLGALRSTEGA